MRRLALLLAVPVGWIACFSSSNPPPPGISFDGSIPDSFTYDVALPDSPADAADSPVDSPPDAVVEAGPAPVVVTVVGIGGLEASVPIVYGDSTGAVSATGTTDANGQASKVVPAGSMITAVMGTAANPWLYTVMGVEPGDSLLVIDRTLPASASFPVQFDGLPTPLPVIDSGSPNYVVYAGGCTNYGMSWSLDLASNSQCIGIGRLGPTLGPAYPLLAEAYDNSSPQNLVGFAFQKDNPLSPLDDAGVLDPVLPGPWSTASTTQTLTGVNVPDGGLSYYLQLSEVADGLQTPLLQQQAMPMFFTHTGYADFVQAEAGFNVSYGGFGSAAVASRSAPPTASGTISVDVSSLATIPAIQTLTVDSSNPAQPRMEWVTVGGPLSSAAGVIVFTGWSGPTIDGGYQSGMWTIVTGDASAMAVQAPQLPASASGWAPIAGANYNGGSSIYGVQGSAFPTYAQLRPAAGVFPPLGGCLPVPLVPPLPNPGSLTVTVFSTGGCG